MVAGVVGCCSAVVAVEIVEPAMVAAVVELLLYLGVLMMESNVERSRSNRKSVGLTAYSWRRNQRE